MIIPQMSFSLSPYSDIYDLIIPKNNLLRQIKESVDFSFVYKELIPKYYPNNGRGAIDPLRMFKYLLLKYIYDLSDVDLVERSRYDMSFKYFLDMAPEEDVIHPSSLTKFRKLRLVDMDLLDLLIQNSVQLAIQKGIKVSNFIVVDSTHSEACFNAKSPREVLVERSKNLRRTIFEINPEIKSKLPVKVNNGILEDEIDYCQKLIDCISEKEELSSLPKVTEKLNILTETIDDSLEQLAISKDQDARVGHKTADTSFFGYKTHFAMVPERIITAAVVTSGEKHDGKQLKTLVEKSKAAGIQVDSVIGDAAYSEKGNLEYAKSNEFSLVSKLSPVDGARTKSYTVSIKSNTHKAHMEFQESEYFKRMSKERYMIEAKNSELKHRHGYDIASSSGLIGMQIQAAVTIYVVNLKRIFNLMGAK